VRRTYLLGEEVLDPPAWCMLGQPVDFEALTYGFEDDLLEGVLGVSTELTGVRVVRMGHCSDFLEAVK